MESAREKGPMSAREKEKGPFSMFSILHCVLAENNQNSLLLFSISFIIFF